jgi:hypothetical protein
VTLDEIAAQIQANVGTGNWGRGAIKHQLEKLVERCASIAKQACLVAPDGGSPTEDEYLVCEEAARRILTLKDE